jgi:hypothetical protein
MHHFEARVAIERQELALPDECPDRRGAESGLPELGCSHNTRYSRRFWQSVIPHGPTVPMATDILCVAVNLPSELSPLR